MSTQLIDLLQTWFEQKDNSQWVLGSIYKTQGPCYRKVGAMMLFGSDGQQLGMLSGGCLESDIQKHARRVMHSGKSFTVTYDGSDEDDLSFQLGIGCGGTIHIVLQPVSSDNDYQQLDKVLQSLQSGNTGQYWAELPKSGFDTTRNHFSSDQPLQKHQLIDAQNKQWLIVNITPPPHILVIGGGIDARPLVVMAAHMGWQVSLWDPRPANARREHFLTANHFLTCKAQSLGHYCNDKNVDAAILMSHNITLDSEALAALTKAHNKSDSLKYLALLGPKNRRAQVLQQAGLCEQNLPAIGLSGPAGFDIGGELPESIALSILSQCHASLHGKAEVNLQQVIQAIE